MLSTFPPHPLSWQSLLANWESSSCEHLVKMGHPQCGFPCLASLSSRGPPRLGPCLDSVISHHMLGHLCPLISWCTHSFWPSPASCCWVFRRTFLHRHMLLLFLYIKIGVAFLNHVVSLCVIFFEELLNCSVN